MLRDDGPATPDADAAPVEGTSRDDAVACARCGHGVTRRSDAIAVGGAQAHVFVNAYGYVFRVGCYREAPGAAAVGESSREWTWFPGYAWRVAVCARCASHLGWWYETVDERFAGLSLDALTGA